MRKRIFSVPAIISLILIAAVVVFWHRGYRVRDRIGFHWNYGSGRIELASYDGNVDFIIQETGTLELSWIDEGIPESKTRTWICSAVSFPFDDLDHGPSIKIRDIPKWGRGLWRQWGPLQVIVEANMLRLRVPAYSILILLAFVPAISIVRWQRDSKRRAAGLCAHCGYDLRYTPDRCPECGQAVHISEDPAATAPSA
jgi:hypothetical protein